MSGKRTTLSISAWLTKRLSDHPGENWSKIATEAIIRRLDYLDNVGQFVECDGCRQMHGAAGLCSSCLSNRGLIERLKKDVEVLRS